MISKQYYKYLVILRWFEHLFQLSFIQECNVCSNFLNYQIQILVIINFFLDFVFYG